MTTQSPQAAADLSPLQGSQERPLVDVRHLVRTVQDAGGELTVLRDVSFSLSAGETVALVGASGSGKSTLLGLVAGLDVPTSGEVWLDGQSLFTLDEDARAAIRATRLGFVFQSFQLMPSLTALDNVMLPLELLGRRDAKAQAVAMLERVGLGHRLGHLPRLLSGGEQQRVALARAFVVQPRLLLADEPTGSLDHATGDAVLQLMMEMNREHGTTLLLVTHDMKLAQACQRILRMDAGSLVD